MNETYMDAWMRQQLAVMEASGNLRTLPDLVCEGLRVVDGGWQMLNLSSNDYLGLAADPALREKFWENNNPHTWLPTSSSSRLLTGNFPVYEQLEAKLASLFGMEAALVFSSGYHANLGILSAICDSDTIILADKLVHASLIDGIRLSAAKSVRYRHNDYRQLARLIEENQSRFDKIIVVTESIFSMDGDEADLKALVDLKRTFPRKLLLYVDEAHAVGVRGKNGLGSAEELGLIGEIDFLVGTFGKALASAGAYLICGQTTRDYLINRMRTFIFTTALPPVNAQWTAFVLDHLARFSPQRDYLAKIASRLHKAFLDAGLACPSTSHIVPLLVGSSKDAVAKAAELRAKGFYVLPIRPPSVPEGTARIRISLTAGMTDEDVSNLINALGL